MNYLKIMKKEFKEIFLVVYFIKEKRGYVDNERS